MIKKRIIAIEIECGRVACGDCDWLDADKGVCEMFALTLEDDCVRDPKCLKAEAKADDMMLKTAMAKAAPQII